MSGDYEPGEPECGFLFPAFRDRSSDTERVNVFAADGNFGKAGGIGENPVFRGIDVLLINRQPQMKDCEGTEQRGKPGFTEETDMWVCPKCGREFKRINQGHYCGKAS